MKKFLSVMLAAVVLFSFVFMALGSGSSDEKNNDSGSVSVKQEEKAEGSIGDYICKVKSAELCKNWEGKDSVKITYEFTNNASEAESFDIALIDDLYQDGVGLESTFISSDDDDFGVDVKIKPGTTKDVSKVYILRDKETEIDVEISEFISLNEEKLTYKVEIKE